MSPTPDFVDVQLSEAGKKAAGNGPLRVANVHFHYEFAAGEPVRVTRAYEWNKVLSQLTFEGEPMLEIVETDEVKPQNPEQGAEDGHEF